MPSSIDYEKGVQMVDSCPESTKWSTEEALCLQKAPNSSYAPTLDIPVISLTTTFVYQNIYCAVCNEDANNLKHITVRVDCRELNTDYNYYVDNDYYDNVSTENEEEIVSVDRFLSEAHYIPGERRFERVLNKSLTHGCKLKIEEYTNLNDLSLKNEVRVCVKPSGEYVRTCDPDWSHKEDFEKCRSYVNTISSEASWNSYQNIHCAVCNFENTSELFSRRRPTITTTFPYLPRYPTQIPLPSYSLSLLFQVESKLRDNCPSNNEVWDPLLGRCNLIVCSGGRIWMDGNCLIKPIEGLGINSTNELNTSFHLNVLCPKIAVRDFVVFDNGSAYSQNRLYSEDEFEVVNETMLICIQDSLYDVNSSALHSYTTMVILIISITCVTLHIIFFISFSRLRSWHGRNLFCMCCSLLLAQLLFLTGISATDNYGFCVFLSVCVHYCWLALFAWMNVLSFDIWRTFRSHFHLSQLNKGKVFLFYSLYAWGIPFLIVMAALLLDLSDSKVMFRPRYAEFKWIKACWINSKDGLLYFFLLPVGIIISENVIFFILTSISIHKQAKESEFANAKSQSFRNASQGTQSCMQTPEDKKNSSKFHKVRFALYVKLGILQGLTWVTALIASLTNSPTMWYIFTVLNGLQGAAIFFFFDLKKWIYKSIWDHLRKIWNSYGFTRQKQSKASRMGKDDTPQKERTRINRSKNDLEMVSSKFKDSRNSESAGTAESNVTAESLDYKLVVDVNQINKEQNLNAEDPKPVENKLRTSPKFHLHVDRTANFSAETNSSSNPAFIPDDVDM